MIVVRLDGSAIVFKLTHPSKALLEIVVSLLLPLKVTVSSEVQFLKTFFPVVTILELISTLVIAVLFSKSPIFTLVATIGKLKSVSVPV